jgi:mRNA-degrading endonuclease RelE of RelBE toxin-antitoxin system
MTGMSEEEKFSIEITNAAKKRLLRFDKEMQRRFAKKVLKLKKDPETYGKPLRNVLSGSWEVYFEKRFRILYSIDREKSKVIIESILHKDEF